MRLLNWLKSRNELLTKLNEAEKAALHWEDEARSQCRRANENAKYNALAEKAINAKNAQLKEVAHMQRIWDDMRVKFLVGDRPIPEWWGV